MDEKLIQFTPLEMQKFEEAISKASAVAAKETAAIVLEAFAKTILEFKILTDSEAARQGAQVALEYVSFAAKQAAQTIRSPA